MYPSPQPETDPIAIWLNGGPGASSSLANFLFNGPMRISKTADTEDDFQVTLAEQGSWSEVATMIYVDQPVGTGFSYAKDNNLLDNMEQAADEFIIFLDNLFKLYPSFVGRDFYLTGESYSGKYIPAFSKRILEENQKLQQTRYNLKASLIGDPYVAPVAQKISMYKVPESLNVLDESNMSQIATMHRRCEEMVNTDIDIAYATCSDIMDEYISKVSGGVFPYDNRIFGYDWDPKEDLVISYLTNASSAQELYENIHVTDSTKDPVFEMSSRRVSEAFNSDKIIDYTHVYQELIDLGFPMMVYAGEFDA